MRVEAGAYFKKGDVLTSTKGCQFIYDGLITKGAMGSICGMATSGDIEFDHSRLWTDVYNEDKKRHVRKAIEEKPKYDFKPFDKVLVKYYEDDNWEGNLFIRTITDDQDGETKYECLNGVVFVHCIPFEGNECLLGITENPEKK